MAGALERRFQLAQSQLKRQESGRRLEEERALKRHFAQAGAIGSGAMLKVGEQQRAKSAERLQSGMLGLQAEKLGQQYQEEQAEKQRGFITSERLGSQEFGAGEAQKQRGFITSERLGSQKYSTAEREAAQKFARGERLSAQEYNTLERLDTQDFQNLQREESQKFATRERVGSQNFASGERVKSEAFQKGLFEIEQEFKEKEFEINKYITLENLNMARRNMGLDPVAGFPGDEIKAPGQPSPEPRDFPILEDISTNEIRRIATGYQSRNPATNKRIVNIGGKAQQISTDEYNEILRRYNEMPFK
jgi:hypothetical protein